MFFCFLFFMEEVTTVSPYLSKTKNRKVLQIWCWLLFISRCLKSLGVEATSEEKLRITKQTLETRNAGERKKLGNFPSEKERLVMMLIDGRCVVFSESG